MSLDEKGEYEKKESINGSTFMGWIYGIVSPEAVLCVCILQRSTSSLGSIISSFLSLWSDIAPSFTLVPNSFLLLLMGLTSAAPSEQESPQSSSAGCAKPAEGQAQPAGRLLLRFLNIFSQFPERSGQTDKRGTRRTQRNLCVRVCINAVMGLEAERAAFLTSLANMCEHLEDGETVSGWGEGGVGGREGGGPGHYIIAAVADINNTPTVSSHCH